MDDFRVGSIPASDPYGNRQQTGSIQRRREKQQQPDGGRESDVETDTSDTIAAVSDADAGESIEDYYLPSDPSEAD